MQEVTALRRIAFVVAGVFLGGFSLSMPLSAATPEQTLDQMPDQAIPESASALVGRLDDIGALGAYWDQDTKALVIIRPAEGLTEAIDSALDGFSVRYQDSPVFRTDYPGLKEAVMSAYSKGDLPPGGWGVSLDYKNGLMVLEGPDRSRVAELLKEYEGRVEFVENTSKGRFLTDVRRYDVAPFYGGGQVFGTFGYGQCTLGFKVIKSGVRYTTTAGHCYPYQTGGNTVQVKTDGGNVLVGTVQYRLMPGGSAPNYTGDLELINGTSYSTRLFNGATATDASTIQVDGAGAPVAGESICYDGSTTFRHCGVTITQTNIMKCIENFGCSDHLAYSTTNLLAQGDSGGPVYKLVGGAAYIRGSISAKDGSGANIHEYFYQWNYAASFFGLTICTGGSPC